MLIKCIIVIWLHRNINSEIIIVSVQLIKISLLLVRKTILIIGKPGSSDNNEKSRLHSSKTLNYKTLPSKIGKLIRFICLTCMEYEYLVSFSAKSFCKELLP